VSSAENQNDDLPRDESFLGRWSRRKRAEPEKREVEDARVAADAEQKYAADAPSPGAPVTDPTSIPADLPAIDELTPESDYGRFMKPDVPVASRNAAMKKLFTDPHFNVMDGLDTYIDDYTKADPIPEAMLRGLAQSRMLKLFNYDKEDAEDAETARVARQDAADQPAADAASVPAQAGSALPAPESGPADAPAANAADQPHRADSYNPAEPTQPLLKRSN
jgi:hypothetical protein